MNSLAQFEFQLTGSSLSPSKSGTGGGAQLNITGTGFTNKTVVKIDGLTCKVLSNTYSMITCLVPSNVSILNHISTSFLNNFDNLKLKIANNC